MTSTQAAYGIITLLLIVILYDDIVRPMLEKRKRAYKVTKTGIRKKKR